MIYGQDGLYAYCPTKGKVILPTGSSWLWVIFITHMERRRIKTSSRNIFSQKLKYPVRALSLSSWSWLHLWLPLSDSSSRILHWLVFLEELCLHTHYRVGKMKCMDWKILAKMLDLFSSMQWSLADLLPFFSIFPINQLLCILPGNKLYTGKKKAHSFLRRTLTVWRNVCAIMLVQCSPTFFVCFDR